MKNVDFYKIIQEKSIRPFIFEWFDCPQVISKLSQLADYKQNHSFYIAVDIVDIVDDVEDVADDA